MMLNRYHICILWVLVCALVGCKKTVIPEAEIEAFLALKKDSLPEVLDYNLHVRPILSDNCFNCHGPDKNKREGGLALHTSDFAYAEVNGNYAVVPNAAHKSELVARILSHDPEKQMPLPASNLVLTDLQKAILIQWINQGATYKPHWAFIEPQKYPVPKNSKTAWGTNEIDAFVLEKMLQKGLQPGPRASRQKLARRAAFDLTGLPPSNEALQAFEADTSTMAYERYIDDLLKSPQYGERMANEWCDVARYADSHGYQDDGESEMWPWRDWAIQAFNQNMPYNQFITEQMAGDLLPNASKSQILATGFHRNHMINAEGGIIDEEFRTEYVLDRVVTTGKAFMALTVECARCHDHKYDPISQKEFYQMASFFNQVDEQGKGNLYENSTGPTLLLSDSETDQKLNALKAKIQTLTEQVSKIQSQKPNNADLALVRTLPEDSLLKKYLVAHISFEPKTSNDSTIYISNKSKLGKLSEMTALDKGYSGMGLKIIGEDPIKTDTSVFNFERNEPFSVSMWVWVPDNASKGYTFLANCASTYHGFRGYELLCIKGHIEARITSSWPSNALAVVSTDSITPKTWQHITLSYDGSSDSKGIRIFINGKLTNAEIKYNHLYRTIKTWTLSDDRKQFAYYTNLQKTRKLTIQEEKILRQLSFKAWYSKPHFFIPGGRRDQGIQPLYNGMVDEIKIYNKALGAVEVAIDYSGKSLPVVLQSKKWSDFELQELTASYVNKQYQNLLSQLKSLRATACELILPVREVKVMRERQTMRPTYILDRGVYDAPKDAVEPGAIAAVLPFDKQLPKNRLGMAQWLTNAKNPLTARVAVNRYWQILFGSGLVASSADFGNQGHIPSHPELLDYLAIWFVEHNWDVKALLKYMIMSATYCQSSVITPESLQKDPQNTYLSRSSRLRLPYEMLRDHALASSGLLHKQIGGPSFKPYQPEGLWEEKTESPVNNYYLPDKAPEIYRRSMYIWIKRTSPHPAMSAFDGPERFVCQVKRQSTNTPLQALTSLNDPQFVECARVLAQKVLEQTNTEPIKVVFYNILQRWPSESEQQLLTKLYKQFALQLNEAQIKKLVSTGTYPQSNTLSKQNLAALTMVAHTIYNLDETISRE